MMNLAKILQDQIGPVLVDKASSALGLSGNEINTAVSKMLPSVVGLMGKQAATPEGAASLFSTLTGDSMIPDNAAALFDSTDWATRTGELGQGAALMDKLLGDDAAAFQQGFAQMSSLPADKASTLLKMGTPMIASKVKGLIQSENLDASAFTSMMANQGEFLKDFDTEGLLGKIGLSGAAGSVAAGIGALKDSAADTLQAAGDLGDKVPEDSVLRRHYEQAKAAAGSVSDAATDLGDAVSGKVAAAVAGVAGTAAAASTLGDKGINTPDLDIKTPSVEVSAPDVDVSTPKSDLPEDSVLRRHQQQASSVAAKTSETVADAADAVSDKTRAGLATAGAAVAGTVAAGAGAIKDKAVDSAEAVADTTRSTAKAATTAAANTATGVKDAVTGTARVTGDKVAAAAPAVTTKSGMGLGKLLGWLALLAALLYGLFTCQKMNKPEVVAEVEQPSKVAPAEPAVPAPAEAPKVEAPVVEAPAVTAEEPAPVVAEPAAPAVVDVVKEEAAATETVVEEAKEEVAAATETVAEEVKEDVAEATEAVQEAATETTTEVTEAASNFGPAVKAEAPAADAPATEAPAAVEETPVIEQIAAFLKDDGAAVPQNFVLKGLNFNTSSAQITDDSMSIVDDLAATLEAYPNVKISLEGHTDSRGVKEANQLLSEARAESVLNTLAVKGISRERMASAGFGPDRPVADNETAEGRLENRRVEVIITAR